MTNFGVAILAFALTAITIPATRGLAQRWGLVDLPDDRKQHAAATPMHAGLCIAVVLMLLGLLFHAHMQPIDWALWLGVVAFGLIGLLDDWYRISASRRMLIEGAILVGMFLYLDFHVRHVGNLFGGGTVWLGWMSVVLTVFAVFCVTNAINMLDGLDGLAGGICVIALSLFLYACIKAGTVVSPLLWVLAGSLFGFLLYNARAPWRSRASVFLGDSGSLLLGFALCWCSIRYSQPGSSAAIKPITAVWILAVPVIDTVYVVIYRLLRRRHIFTPGRDHIHHRLLDAGLDEVWAVRVLWLVAFALGSIGLLAEAAAVPEVVMFGLFVFLSVIYLLWSLRQEKRAAHD